MNSMIVTCGSIAAVLLFGAMAAFALSEYRFRLNTFFGLFLTPVFYVTIRLLVLRFGRAPRVAARAATEPLAAE